MSNNKKGSILEDLVSNLFVDESVSVRTRVKLPSLSNPRRKREVDILVSGNILGYTRYIAIECKNYTAPVQVGTVDEFRGKLEDIGIPVQNGMLVTSGAGFTIDAIDRASHLGIKTLIFDGLSSDQVSQDILTAFYSTVYLTLGVERVLMTFEQEVTTPDYPYYFYDSNRVYKGHLVDLVWAGWRDACVDQTIGSQSWVVPIPSDWYIEHGSQLLHPQVSVDLRVTGYLVELPGVATKASLRTTSDNTLERGQIHFEFDTNPKSLPTTRIDSAEQLEATLASREHALVRVDVGFLPAPRIRFENLYWPLSERIVRLMPELAHQRVKSGQWKEGFLSKIPLKQLEGSDLSGFWEPIWNKHPAAKDPRWPWSKPSKLTTNPKHKRRPH